MPAQIRAGWAVHLAGDLGYELEKKFTSQTAGALIYAASVADKIPNFFTDDDTALEDIARRVGVKSEKEIEKLIKTNDKNNY